MRVEAKRTEKGFLIPLVDEFSRLKRDSVLLDIEFVETDTATEYAALDQLIGLCDSGQPDASERHDQLIFGSKRQR